MMNLYPFMMMPIYNLPDDKFFRPPLLSDLLNSLVNFDRTEKVKLSDIPQAASSLVFDFEYPLSSNVDKEKFETMILKKFFTRRIGYETYTTWKMQLDVKMNEIMPVYNKLFDAMSNWNLFSDGSITTRISTDERSIDTTNENTTTTSNTSTSSDTRKFSNLPQNEISDINDSSYMTDYTKNDGTGSASATGTSNTTVDTDDVNTHNETVTTDVSNKIDIYTKFLVDRNHIMTLIYKDLDSLFYGLV